MVVGIIRTSTFKQEIDSQKSELAEFIKSCGYSEDEIIWIGGAGISAIKENEQYDEMYAQLYSCLKKSDVKCVFAWELSRIGRREIPIINLKNYLIQKKIQLRIKEPGMYLLDSGGTVNTGMELALSLFITMSKQEMENKKARFKRAKDRLRSEGKYLGGRILYGYEVKDKRFVLNQEEAKIVKMVWKRYSTGAYSYAKLAEELSELGYTNRGRKINATFIQNTLSKDRYIDIVGQKLFDKVKLAREGNKLSICSKERHVHLAQGILKCPKCGRNMIAHYDRYKCTTVRYGVTRFYGEKCTHNLAPLIEIIDKAVYNVAVKVYEKEFKKQQQEAGEKLLMKIWDLEIKIGNLTKRLSNFDKKADRLLTMYIDGKISERDYDKQSERINAEKKIFQNKIDQYQVDRKILYEMDFEDGSIDNMSDEEKKKIVHKYIREVRVDRETHDYSDFAYGKTKRPPKSGTYTLYRITMTLFNDKIEIIRYRPKFGYFQTIRKGNITEVRHIWQEEKEAA